MPQLSVIDVLSTNEMCGDTIPVMTVDRRVDPVHRFDELWIGNLTRCNPSGREFSDGVVKVVGIETYDVAHQIGVIKFDDVQQLNGDRPIGIIDVAITPAGQR